MIKLQVIGHLGKDSTVNTVNGKSVINFSVAHSEKYKDAQGNQVEKTIWVECAYWTDRTAVAPYLKKGTQVYAEGQPEVRTWESNGKNGASLTMRVSSVQLLGTKEGGDGQSSYQPQQSQPANYNTMAAVPSSNDVSEPADDLPF